MKAVHLIWKVNSSSALQNIPQPKCMLFCPR